MYRERFSAMLIRFLDAIVAVSAWFSSRAPQSVRTFLASPSIRALLATSAALTAVPSDDPVVQIIALVVWAIGGLLDVAARRRAAKIAESKISGITGAALLIAVSLIACNRDSPRAEVAAENEGSGGVSASPSATEDCGFSPVGSGEGIAAFDVIDSAALLVEDAE